MNKKLKNKLKKKIRVIPNFPKKGIQFQDITSITDSKPLFTEVVNEISKYCKMKNKIADIRKDYKRGSMSLEDLKHNPIDQFNIWFNNALSLDVMEVNAMVLSTV